MDKWNDKNRPLTLFELQQYAEEALLEDIPNNIFILPPENACDDNTDEDSGEEDNVCIGNLPGSQLRTKIDLEQLQFINDTDSEYDTDDEIPLSQLKTKFVTKRRKTFNWIKDDLPNCDSAWESVQYATNNPSCLEIFEYFFDDNLWMYILDETNRYASQHNRNNNITLSEMKCFIGVLLLSGYNPLPRRRMYWENSVDCGNELVKDAISRDKFNFIMSNTHFANNNTLDKNDKYSKLRPLITELNKKFQEFAPIEEFHSIDEAMVPYFGRHGCKQFIRGKPIRWGYKFWTGTTRNGYVVWFSPYQGSSGPLNSKYRDMGLGASVVLTYADILLSLGYNLPYHLFFDNFFTSLHLLEELSNKNLRGTGTIRENRTSKCPLTEKSAMKKLPRGSFDYRKESETNIIVCKWNDNSIVSVASNCITLQPVRQVERYSQKEKKKVYVQQPNLIKLYNENMGGVDRADQNISLYRTAIRGKKWYFPIFAHCLDMAIHNAWQLYKRNSADNKKDHLAFRRCVATALLEANRKSGKRGPSKNSTSLHEISRFDRMDHLPAYKEKQTRCGVCHKKVQSVCTKCNIALHIKNCFILYHTKE